MLKDANHLIESAIDADCFTHSVAVRKKRFGDGRSQHDHLARVLLVKGADKSSTPYVKQRDRRGVVGLRAAQDHLFHAAVSTSDHVGVAKDESAGANCRDDLHVGCSLADEVCIVVLKVLADANALGKVEEIGARRKS